MMHIGRAAKLMTLEGVNEWRDVGECLIAVGPIVNHKLDEAISAMPSIQKLRAKTTDVTI